MYSILIPSPFRKQPRQEPFGRSDLPPTFPHLVWRIGPIDQIWLSLLSITVAVLDTAPLEVQRRLVNQSVAGGDFDAIIWLGLIYLALVTAEGLTKLVMNVYRGWISENATRRLRSSVSAATVGDREIDERGTEAAMMLSEVDPIGGFIGDAVSEPLLNFGMLIAVFGYLTLLDPLMATVGLLCFAPQLVFVPLMQRAINRRIRARIVALRAVGAGAIDEHTEALRFMQEIRFSEVFDLNIGILRLKYTLNFLMNLTQHTGVIAILTLGGWFVINGETELGTVVAFASGLRNLTEPWGNLVNYVQNLWMVSTKYEMLRDAVVCTEA